MRSRFATVVRVAISKRRVNSSEKIWESLMQRVDFPLDKNRIDRCGQPSEGAQRSVRSEYERGCAEKFYLEVGERISSSGPTSWISSITWRPFRDNVPRPQAFNIKERMKSRLASRPPNRKLWPSAFRCLTAAGIEVITQIRRRGRDLCVLVLTVDLDEVLLANCQRLGLWRSWTS